MGRKRKNPLDTVLPKRVYRGRSAWEWKSPGGKTIRLCRLDAPLATVLARHQEADGLHPAENTVAWLAKQYFEGADFERKSDVTKADYRQASIKPLAVFGRMQPDSVTPPHIRQYMDKRGAQSTYRANRELSLMHVIFAHGYERGHVRANPCIGVKPFPERRRRHYVDQETYLAVRDRAPAPLRVAMELAYCTGLRQADVLSLQWHQVKADGIHVQQQKTGKAVIKAITPRVQAALDLARTLPCTKGITSLYVVHTQAGRRYTRDGFKSLWHRLAAGFTFHDLRRAGTSDFEGERKLFTGHATERMAESYAVLPIKSPSH